MKLNINLLALATAATLGLSGQAFAAGTAAGTNIQNTVTLGYTVNTVQQTDLTQDVTFKVDTKVDFTLVSDESNTRKITPKGNSYVSSFTLTSASNDTLDFDISSADLASGSHSFKATTVTDNFDLDANLSIFVENGTTLGYQSTGPDADTATNVNDLAADDDVTIYLVVTTAIDENQANEDIAAIALTADALQSDGTAIPTADNTAAFIAGTKQFVIADTDLDASETTNTAFEVGTAKFTDPTDLSATPAKFTLELTVINDPMCQTDLDSTDSADYSAGACPNAAVMGATYKPKAIPGAMVEYTLKAKNSGSADASSVVFTQDLLSTHVDNIDLLTGSLDNVAFTFNNLGVLAHGTSSAATTSDVLNVSVTNFEVDEDITITFTAIVE